MKPLRCWFGRHSWTKVPTKDGEGVVQCAHCGHPYRDSSDRYGSGGWPDNTKLYGG